MTAEVTAQAEQLLGLGCTRREVAEELDVKFDTLRKAIDQPPSKTTPWCHLSFRQDQVV